MKKLLALLLTFVLLATALVGCGNNDNPPDNEPEQSQSGANGDATTDSNETVGGNETTDGEGTTDGNETTNGNSEVTYSQGLVFELSYDKSSYYLSSVGTCRDSEVIIPAEYNSLPVTEIATDAFENCTWITKVTIPDSVTIINCNSFVNCPNVGETHDGVTYIGKWLIKCDTSVANITIREDTVGIATWAFWGCNQITEVVIPDSVKHMNMIFRDCSSLKSVTLPNGLTKIGASLFQECTALESVTIPSSVNTIGDSAFYGCRSLTTITLPEGLTTIGTQAFEYCSSLVSIIIPDSVTSIGSYAFHNCQALKTVKLSNSLISIEERTFYYCLALETVNIPDGVTSIGKEAFAICGNNLEIVIPDSVTSIEEAVFFNSFATSISLGKGITSIPAHLFNGSKKLRNIYFDGTLAEWKSLEKGSNWNKDVIGCMVICNDGNISISSN